MKKLDGASVPHLTKALNTHSGDPVFDSVDSNRKRRWMEKLDSGSVPVMCLLCKCGCALRKGPSRYVDWEECFPNVGTWKRAFLMCGLERGFSLCVDWERGLFNVWTRKRPFCRDLEEGFRGV